MWTLWNSHDEMKTFFFFLLGEEQGQGHSVIPTRGEGGGDHDRRHADGCSETPSRGTPFRPARYKR